MKKDKEYYESLDKRSREYKEYKKTLDTGLGDVIANVTKKTGIDRLVKFVAGEDCGCDDRKEKLNKIKLSRGLKPRCLTEDEYLKYKEFKENRTITLSHEQVTFVVELYASVFNVPVYRPCLNCSPRPLINMRNTLDKIFDTYETN